MGLEINLIRLQGFIHLSLIKLHMVEFKLLPFVVVIGEPYNLIDFKVPCKHCWVMRITPFEVVEGGSTYIPVLGHFIVLRVVTQNLQFGVILDKEVDDFHLVVELLTVSTVRCIEVKQGVHEVILRWENYLLIKLVSMEILNLAVLKDFLLALGCLFLSYNVVHKSGCPPIPHKLEQPGCCHSLFVTLGFEEVKRDIP